MSNTKDFRVAMSTLMWEEFFKLFPNYGERSTFLREKIRERIAEERKKKESKNANSR